MILPIYIYGQPVLRKVAEDITPDYPDLKVLINNMYETLDSSNGIGLAAPQIGLPIRLVVIDLDVLSEDFPEYKGFRHAFINAHILELDEENTDSSEEGCLSIPGINEKVVRPTRIHVKYMDEVGDDEETTVIKVNLDLDKSPYQDAIKVTDKTKLVLANKHHYLGKEYIPNNLTSIPQKYTIDGDDNTKGTKEAVDAAIKMIEAAKKEGLNLLVNSGYRSYTDQEETYHTYLSLYGESYVERFVVKAGYSEHQTGYAFDFASGNSNIFQNSQEYQWMIKNSYKYGFCYRFLRSKEEITEIRHEAWHFRYVGTKAAKIMDKEELSLEEYYAKYVEK